ncbi:MAG: hypothetical protein JKX81_05425 [Arenicella sp.]|nr:hypothetical protein [Arenicella sp.]
MRIIQKRLLVFFALAAVLALLVYDARPHFDKDLIQLKRENNSAQRNWSLFFGQRFVFYEGPFRYEDDMNRIRDLIEPGRIVLSDLATSYYAAASLPVYVRNVHRHQGREYSSSWRKLLNRRTACNLHQQDVFLAFNKFIDVEQRNSASREQPQFKYVLVNKDSNNKNLRLDCLWHRRALLMENIVRVSKLKYEGEFLNLYEINDRSPTSASDG